MFLLSECATSRENKCCNLLISGTLGSNFTFEGMGVNTPPFPRHVCGRMLMPKSLEFQLAISNVYSTPFDLNHIVFCGPIMEIEFCNISSSELGIGLGRALREPCVLVEDGDQSFGIRRCRKISTMHGTYYGYNHHVGIQLTSNWPSRSSSNSMVDLPNAGDQCEAQFGPFINNVLDDIASGDPWSLHCFFLLGPLSNPKKAFPPIINTQTTCWKQNNAQLRHRVSEKRWRTFAATWRIAHCAIAWKSNGVKVHES